MPHGERTEVAKLATSLVDQFVNLATVSDNAASIIWALKIWDEAERA